MNKQRTCLQTAHLLGVCLQFPAVLPEARSIRHDQDVNHANHICTPSRCQSIEVPAARMKASGSLGGACCGLTLVRVGGEDEVRKIVLGLEI